MILKLNRVQCFFLSLRCIHLIPSFESYLPSDLARTPADDSSCSSLDDAQAVALVDSLTRSLALVQGPPGTGKSYTGVAMIKVLLDNKKTLRTNRASKIGPIICVCYTNHALDQLLEHLVEAGVEQIVRIGSRSKSEILAGLNLRVIAKNVPITKAEGHGMWQMRERLEKNVKQLQALTEQLKASESWVALRNFLQMEHPAQFNQLCPVEDEDGFQNVVYNEEHYLRNWLRSGHHIPGLPQSIEHLTQAHIFSLSHNERRVLYNHWIYTIKQKARDKFLMTIAEFQESKENLSQIRSETDLRALQQSNIIGVTTSGLARNLPLLRRLQSKVMMCEEAGEVLEAHTLTAFLPSVEHAILIGDHLQLRPSVQNYDLTRENPKGKQYSFDTSLFERLVEPDTDAPKVPYTTLESQRRMHPSVSRLIRDTLYPALTDAGDVESYPEVVGIKKRLFWLDHNHREGGSASDLDQTSKWNQYEVDMTAALVNHLVNQGAYEPDEIAVLTPYLGQLNQLRNRLGASHAIVIDHRDQEILEQAGLDVPSMEAQVESPVHSNGVMKTTLLKALRVATVDNFQGEEAKVIVISLVRSNPEKKVGFLRTSNRINVLLSRAKHGMYIIGDSDTAGYSVPMWSKVITMLREDGNLGPQLELQCPRHRETAIAVTKPDDFATCSPEGGCNLICGDRLSCGHSCQQRCHSNVLHGAVHCMEPCPRPLKGCDHPCPKYCGDNCPKKCLVNIYDANRKLFCGHEAPNLPCWQSRDLETVKCNIQVERIVPGCTHKVEVPCHQDVTSPIFECRAICASPTVCGHVCKKKCKSCVIREHDPDGRTTYKTDHGVCQQRCGRNYTTCNHSCDQRCHGEVPCASCIRPCENRCSHSRCAKLCSEPCRPCAESHCASECQHSLCTMPCAAPCNHLPCSKRCAKKLSCGHQCMSPFQTA